MGNRPQGSKFAYTIAAVFFALLMGYMLFCSVWLTIKGIEATLATLNSEGSTFRRKRQRNNLGNFWKQNLP